MSPSAPFIRRPIATALLIVAIVLGGHRVSTVADSGMPDVAFPTISVTAQLPGADPRTMAS